MCVAVVVARAGVAVLEICWSAIGMKRVGVIGGAGRAAIRSSSRPGYPCIVHRDADPSPVVDPVSDDLIRPAAHRGPMLLQPAGTYLNPLHGCGRQLGQAPWFGLPLRRATGWFTCGSFEEYSDFALLRQGVKNGL